jgi:hypothetical protein
MKRRRKRRLDKKKLKRVFYSFAILIIILVGLTTLTPLFFTPNKIVWTNQISAINTLLIINVLTFAFAIYQIKTFSPLREHLDKIFIHFVLSLALIISIGSYFGMILSDGASISPIIMFMMMTSTTALNIFLPVGYSFILEIEDTKFLPKMKEEER